MRLKRKASSKPDSLNQTETAITSDHIISEHATEQDHSDFDWLPEELPHSDVGVLKPKCGEMPVPSFDIHEPN